MKRDICTLLDKNYLFRALALYDSLREHCPQFTLWVLCMDEKSYELLQKLNLKDIRLIRLSEVEDNRLKSVKPTRTGTEYCWMFSSSLPLYLLEKNPDMKMITYIDADIYLYDSIETIYNEFGNNSIMIIPHNSSKENKWREKTSGIYNVGMMIFRNDSNGLEALKWWKDRVIEWCFSRYEDRKYGDQLYLNDWPTRFRDVYVLLDPGTNVASWNIGRYAFSENEGKIIGKEKETSKTFPLIFYHFHGLKLYLGRKDKIKAYPIGILHKRIYSQYIEVLQREFERIKIIDKDWNFGFAAQPNILRLVKQYIQRLLI